MKGLRSALALVSAILMGCGGASEATSSGGAASAADELTMNIPDAEWVRFEVPEGGVSISTPGAPVRRVSTRESSQTFEYVVAREPLAIVVAVERLGGVLVGDGVSEGLDGVAAFLDRRSMEPARGCTPGATETIRVAGQEGRLVVGTHCTAISDGTLAVAAFLHGSMLVSVVAVGEGVGLRNVRSLLMRTIDTVALGAAPSWFQPVDAEVAVANVPGLTLRMPHGVVSETVEQEGVITARYTSEPIRGMATVVSVTAPAALSAAQYCASVATGGALELVDSRSHLGEPRGYCEVRGRVVSRPELYQIHDIVPLEGAVLEIIWVGPHRPEFVSGGDAQLAEIRASVTTP